MTAVQVFVLLVTLIGLAFVRTRKRNTDLAQLDWSVLVGKIEPLPIDVITRVAVDFLQPGSNRDSVDTQNLWELIGKDEGLQRLYSNSHVLMALAWRARGWDPKESFVAIEQMRRDAVVLRRAVIRLSLGMSFGYDRRQGPFSVQQAMSSYYLMRSRVLSLYANHHGPRLLELAAVL